jgi:hypothetical protein
MIYSPSVAKRIMMTVAAKEARIAIFTLSLSIFPCVSVMKTGMVPTKSMRINRAIVVATRFSIYLNYEHISNFIFQSFFLYSQLMNHVLHHVAVVGVFRFIEIVNLS